MAGPKKPKAATAGEKRDEAVEVQFPLETDGEGWPPLQVEPIWCRPVPSGHDHYVVTNVPIHVLGISRGDVIRASRSAAGPLQFDSLVERGGHGTIRVIVADPSQVEAVAQTLAGFGCGVGDTYIEQLLTLDLSPEVNYAAVRGWLMDAEAAGRVDWEEGALAPSHRTLH